MTSHYLFGTEVFARTQDIWCSNQDSWSETRMVHCPHEPGLGPDAYGPWKTKQTVAYLYRVYILIGKMNFKQFIT